MYFSVSQPRDKILREASHVAHCDVQASNMDALYLQDAVTQIRSHMPPEGHTAPAQVPLKTPHMENNLAFGYTASNPEDTGKGHLCLLFFKAQLLQIYCSKLRMTI